MGQCAVGDRPGTAKEVLLNVSRTCLEIRCVVFSPAASSVLAIAATRGRVLAADVTTEVTPELEIGVSVAAERR